MRAEATTEAPADTGADTIAIGLFEGEPIAHDVDGGALQALVDSGEAKPKLRKLAVAHAGGNRYVLAGLGKREEFGFASLRDWFQALYRTLLGSEQGPRMGSFIALYGIANTRRLIAEALER